MPYNAKSSSDCWRLKLSRSKSMLIDGTCEDDCGWDWGWGDAVDALVAISGHDD